MGVFDTMSMVETGIPGLDELLSSNYGNGFPKNTTTLVYGPPKVGKSIFSYQFTYHGLNFKEPCLYITMDDGIKQLTQNMMDFGWFLQGFIDEELLYVIDPTSSLSGARVENTETYTSSKINDPTDLMVKVGVGTRFVFKKSNAFRSVFDSLTTSFIFNPEPMVIRFLKNYLRRLKEAGATILVNYTEGVASPETERILKSIVDNEIILDGSNMTFKSSDDFMAKAKYEITDQGIVLGEGKVL
ncbi:hypothetical protein MBMB1_1081 [Methanobacterium sp. MB1]|jgi:KaiC/GvpD/RAD55 family RecA-like ATPase|nr:hypothetical protein MBMB1_1081 [Methanobacterium sp. MB1]